MSRNWDAPLGRGMAHETVFAVRTPEGWRMFAWECQPDDVEAKMAEEGMAGLEWRLVTHHHVAQGLHGHFMTKSALRKGWHRHRESGLWYPMEEPVPPIPGTPFQGDVSLSLLRIVHGIEWSVTAGEKTITACIDEIDDSLVMWVRFIQLLAQGGFPHAALCNEAPTHLVVQDAAEANRCRFYVKDYGGDEPKVVDVIVSRSALVEQFTSFAAAISDHPCFAHSYLCCGSLPDDLVEIADDAAEAEWQAGVAAGRYPDDWDAERDFVERRIAAAVPLPENLSPWVDKYRLMLRTLEIPAEWA